MARSEPIRNTYEEFADELKGLNKIAKSKEEHVLVSEHTKDALIQDHEWHLRFLQDGVLQARNFILPPPYTPSRVTPDHARKTHIKNLIISSRHSGEIVVVRTITEPYVYSSSITIVEDENGEVARLTACNLEDSSIDPILYKGIVIAVKQPCWSIAAGGSYHIRVDHPSDLVILDVDSEMMPTAWKRDLKTDGIKTAMEWKNKGDMMFLEKKFRSALAMYVC